MQHPTSLCCTICGKPDVSELLNLAAKSAKIMVCNHCRNAFTIPKPQLPDYENEDFQATTGDLETLTFFDDLPVEIKKSYTVQREMIEKRIPKESWILEIGGGEGIFLELMAKQGYNTELVEPSFSAARRAKKRGLIVHNDYLQKVTFNRKYKLICMSHVLEHIDKPIDVLNNIKTLIEPGGFILLAQTNFKGFMPRLLKEHWYAWVPEQHFSHFSVDGLKYMVKQASLKVSEYRYSRLVHGKSIYHDVLKYTPFLQDQIHILLQKK